MPRTYKIVLTGGPCAWKTTSMMRIKNFLQDRGYIVIIIPEAATLMSSTGVEMNHQKPITRTQKNNEDVLFDHAEFLAREKGADVVVLLDRGLADGAVYVAPEDFERLLAECGLPSLDRVGARYDQVLHLVSAANGAEGFYDTNAVRVESLEHARFVEAKTLEVWSHFDGLKVFDNKNKSFESKMREVVGAVCAFLRIPHTERIPQKFLLDSRLTKVPESVPTTEMAVEKIFVTNVARPEGPPQGGDEKSYSFIRKSLCKGVSSFVIKTVSFRNNQRIERKENLTSRKFEIFKQFADPSRAVVRQSRKLFSLGDAHYELCRYQEPMHGVCQLSVHSAPGEGGAAKFPPWLILQREVTGDPRHTAHFLSLLDQSGDYEFEGATPEHVVYEKVPAAEELAR